jgi:hypothetical protein
MRSKPAQLNAAGSRTVKIVVDRKAIAQHLPKKRCLN